MSKPFPSGKEKPRAGPCRTARGLQQGDTPAEIFYATCKVASGGFNTGKRGLATEIFKIPEKKSKPLIFQLANRPGNGYFSPGTGSFAGHWQPASVPQDSASVPQPTTREMNIHKIKCDHCGREHEVQQVWQPTALSGTRRMISVQIPRVMEVDSIRKTRAEKQSEMDFCSEECLIEYFARRIEKTPPAPVPGMKPPGGAAGISGSTPLEACGLSGLPADPVPEPTIDLMERTVLRLMFEINPAKFRHFASEEMQAKMTYWLEPRHIEAFQRAGKTEIVDLILKFNANGSVPHPFSAKEFHDEKQEPTYTLGHQPDGSYVVRYGIDSDVVTESDKSTVQHIWKLPAKHEGKRYIVLKDAPDPEIAATAERMQELFAGVVASAWKTCGPNLAKWREKLALFERILNG